MTKTQTASHRISWWVYAGNGTERARISVTPRGLSPYGYIATCSCGWEMPAGNAAHVKDVDQEGDR